MHTLREQKPLGALNATNVLTLSYQKLFWVFLGIAFGVMVFPLGIMPLLDDESTRALVSLEMVVSGNYWVPTINGELYQNKPPLFNWLIAGLMHAIPHFSEFYLRLPSLMVLLIMTALIYLLFKKEVGEETAFFSAFAFLTSGRILFYDSMLGYIDPFFSLAIFLNLTFLYKLDLEKRPWFYFIVSYGLCWLAYMLKGIPALVFQTISLTVALYLKSHLKALLSKYHALGIVLFFAGLTLYYAMYAVYFPLDKLFATLWEQSSSRTLVGKSPLDNAAYVFGFPFEFVMHFLPWSLLVIYCIRSDIGKTINRHSFVQYCFVVLIANLAIYWLSPETRPRYLFMFLPFYFTILFYVFIEKATSWQKRATYRVLLGLTLLLSFVSFTPFFLEELDFVAHKELKTACISITLLVLAFYMWYSPNRSMAAFVIVLLVVRMGFNFFVLPSREREAPESQYKRFGHDIAQLTRTANLHLLDETLLDHDICYYVSNRKGQILSRRIGKVEKNCYFLCYAPHLQQYGLEPCYIFYTDFEKRKVYLALKR